MVDVVKADLSKQVRDFIVQGVGIDDRMNMGTIMSNLDQWSLNDIEQAGKEACRMAQDAAAVALFIGSVLTMKQLGEVAK